MARVTPLLATFGGGEISPLLRGRVDLQWYPNCCQRLRNMVAITEGAATRRPASRFVAEVANSALPAILKRFEFSTLQAFMTEWGDRTLRFYAEKAPIVSAGLPVTVVTPFAATELRTLKIVQSADVLFLFHPSHPPYQLERFSDINWRLEPMRFTDGPYLEVNADETALLTPGATSGNAVTLTASGGGLTLMLAGLLPALAPVDVTLDPGTLQLVLPASAPAIATGQKLTVSGNLPVPLQTGTDYYWISVDPTHGQLAASPADALVPTPIVLTPPAFAPFRPTDLGRLVRLGYIAPDWLASTAYLAGAIVKNGANGVYRCAIAGTSAGTGGPTGIGLAIGDGTVAWDYVNAGGIEWGYGVVTVYTSPSVVTVAIVVSFGASTATSFWRLGLYSATTGYPACGMLHQQRMLMAGAAVIPDRVDASVTADYGNFTPGDIDSDPISETLGLPGVDAIHWMASKRVAYLGTQGSVQKAYGTTGYDSALTPASFEAIEQVQRGSQDLAPVRIINGLVYAHRLSRKIFELYYDFTQDLDLATELTARARHLTKGGVLDMDYAQEPYSILWTVRNDGTLLGLTYYREQQMIAWHAHTLGGGGIVESVATIPGGDADQLWMVVRRTIDGVIRRYIEVLDDFGALEDFETGADGGTLGLLDEDLFFGDAYALYAGAPATVISGLDYLEGQAVTVLADGAVVPGLTVTAGEVTLPLAASRVYVGLPYLSELLPMPIEAGAQEGTPVGKLKRVDKVRVGVYRSGTFVAGEPTGPQWAQPMRQPSDDMDSGVPLFTGVYEFDFDGDFAFTAEIRITASGPQPLTVLWIAPRLATQEG